jgi:hypothetical protein
MKPAPWELTGHGYVFLFRFPKAFILEHGFIPPELKDRYRGGFGAVMLVDYHSSPVGAYHEALFIPGLFDFGNKRKYSITKIYVSTIDSVINGQENWGIPKELADFDVQPYGNNLERFRMLTDGQIIIDALIETLPQKMPVNTQWLPFRPGLIQTWADKQYLTTPYAKGKVSLASLQSVYVDPAHFPDFGYQRPLTSVHATDIVMTFPKPEMLHYADQG